MVPKAFFVSFKKNMKTVRINFGRRSLFNRRMASDGFYPDERRSGTDRRSGSDRRNFMFHMGKFKKRERRAWLVKVP